jgi:small subunit ribosomal protein S5e
MADEDWGEEAESVGVALPPPPAELPEIKLFNKWSCDEVQVSDMSLQVRGGHAIVLIFN